MKNLFLLIFTLASGCCISADTKILARKISNSAAIQTAEISQLVGLRLESGQKISETSQGDALLRRSIRLKEATAGLADLLGAPEEVE